MATTKREWLTVNEAAQRLGVTAGRLRQFICQGRLQVVALHPRANVIPMEEFERFSQLERPNGRPRNEEDE